MIGLYRISLASTSLLLLFAAACAAPVNAPSGTEIAELDNIDVFWNYEWEGDPTRWALARTEFFVYDGETEMPRNNVVIEVFSGYSGVYVLPTGVINVANCPEGEGQWDSYCSDPDQTWGELTGDFNDSLRPTYYRGYTDGSGIETVWFWIEDMPVADENVGEVPISASIGVSSVFFDITPST